MAIRVNPWSRSIFCFRMFGRLFFILVFGCAAALANGKGRVKEETSSLAASSNFFQKKQDEHSQSTPLEIKLVFRVQSEQAGLGEVTDILRLEGNRYQIKSETRPAGLLALFPKAHIQRESRGRYQPKGSTVFWPTDYYEQRGQEKPRVAQIDYRRRQLWLDAFAESSEKPNTTARKETPWPDSPVNSGDSPRPKKSSEFPILDTLTALYQWTLRGDFPARYTFWATDGLRLTEYTYVADGEETLSLPGVSWPDAPEIAAEKSQDEVATYRYHKVTSANEPELRIWYAQKLRLPVKVRYQDAQGKTIEQVLVRCEWL